MSQNRSALPLSAMWSGCRAPSHPTGCTVPPPTVPGSVPCATTAPPDQAKPQCWPPWMGPCLHTRLQSLAQVNPRSSESTIILQGLGSFLNEDITRCAAKQWQGWAMGCHIHSAQSLRVLSVTPLFPPLSKNPCRLAGQTAAK